MRSQPRPISPHITIYRWQLTSILSMLHRMTGIILCFGIVTFETSLLYTLQQGEAAFLAWVSLARFFSLLLFPLIFCFFYHVLNGIRHIVFDFGKGFVWYRISGYGVLLLSFVTTVIVWRRFLCG